MTKLNQIYKCNVCGNIVDVVHSSYGELVCCGQPMQLMEEKTTDEGQEKHVPVVERTEGGSVVKVGSVPHPMEEEHHIEWIEITTPSGTYRKFLKPGEDPQAQLDLQEEVLVAREYCTLHGLWTS